MQKEFQLLLPQFLFSVPGLQQGDVLGCTQSGIANAAKPRDISSNFKKTCCRPCSCLKSLPARMRGPPCQTAPTQFLARSAFAERPRCAMLPSAHGIIAQPSYKVPDAVSFGSTVACADQPEWIQGIVLNLLACTKQRFEVGTTSRGPGVSSFPCHLDSHDRLVSCAAFAKPQQPQLGSLRPYATFSAKRGTVAASFLKVLFIMKSFAGKGRSRC